ncbi:MAG: T9SS type A sorting domain-containing protein [Chitinophagales bacterium]|nr:T9SS type A sorting domain-containing protein [Chitinophagales bacterium]
MLKKTTHLKLLFGFVALLNVQAIFSQVMVNHPLQLVNMAVHSSELTIFQTENTGGSPFPVQGDLVHYRTDSGLTSLQRLQLTDTFKLSTSNTLLQSRGFGSVNCIAIDKGADSYNEMIYAFSNAANGITIALPQINKTTLKIDAVTYDTIVTGAGFTDEPRIKLTKINRGTPSEGFIIAYHDYTTHHVNLMWYAIDNNNQLQRMATAKGDTLYMLNGKDEVFDVVDGNFDGNGIMGEFALATVRKVGVNAFVYLSTFHVASNGPNSVISKFYTNQIHQIGEPLGYKNLSLASGLFNAAEPNFDQIAIGSLYLKSGGNSEYVRQLQLVYCPANFGISAFVLGGNYSDSAIWNSYPAMALKAGQLNTDVTDEMVFAIDGSYDIFKVNPGLQLQKKATGSGGSVSPDFYQAVSNNNYMDIEDVDYDFENDIVMVVTNNSGNQQFLQVTISTPADTNLNTLAVKASPTQIVNRHYSGNSNMYRFAIAFAELRGGKAILREPIHTVRTRLEPLVVLNTPPYHLDSFENNRLDVNQFFTYAPWDYNSFVTYIDAKYITSSAQNYTLETELKSDWGVSAEVTGGGKILGMGVKANIKAKYGEEFSNTSMSSQTVTITTSAETQEDDFVHAAVSEYDVYEYPIDSSGTMIGYVLALMRKGQVAYTWMGSKDNNAYKFIPDHEVGNLFSYSKAANVKQYVGMADTNSYTTISGYTVTENFGTGITHNFDYNQVSQNGSSATKTFGVEAGASVELGGFGLEVNGEYNRSELTTHTSSVTTNVNYEVTLKYGTTSLNIGYPAQYVVKPYIYWGKNGAMNLNYSVDLVDSSGAGPTLWSHYYKGKPDLTLIRPWGLEPEKRHQNFDNILQKRDLTKSLQFNRERIDSNTVLTITAYIQNYSMTDYSGNAEFQFYLGHPDSANAVLLQDLSGNTLHTVNNFSVPAQGRSKVVFQTLMNKHYAEVPQIYIVIDPNNLIDEIHEDNNRGTNIAYTNAIVSGIAETEPEISFEAKLAPNPSAETTELRFALPKDADVDIALFDVTGRQLQTLYQKKGLWAGKYMVPVQTASLAKGVYYVSIMLNGEKQKTLQLSVIR